jgi:hypothetical protein
MEYIPGRKIEYPQPYSIHFPNTGNPVYEEHMIEKLHHQLKQEARQRYKSRKCLESL